MRPIQDAFPLLQTPKKIFITTHHKPDGDAIGSMLGLAIYLAKKGHKVTAVSPGEIPDFVATVTSDPVDETIFRDSNRSITPLPALHKEVSIAKHPFTNTGFWQTGDYEFPPHKREAPAGQRYYHNSLPVSLLLFDGKTDQNIYYGITKANFFSDDPARIRQLLTRGLIVKSVPESKKLPSLYRDKPGIVGTHLSIFSFQENPYYPQTLGKPFAGSPAEKAGIQHADLIVAVNGVSTKNKTFSHVVSMIRGNVGEAVHLDIFRDGKPLHLDMIRASEGSIR
ncbi:MAG: PDZ domain-containing protein [Candidatus Kapaibacterium sp.]